MALRKLTIFILFFQKKEERALVTSSVKSQQEMIIFRLEVLATSDRVNTVKLRFSESRQTKINRLETYRLKRITKSTGKWILVI